MNVKLAGAFPRPDFRRENWLSLDGEWEFAFDDGDEGVSMRWMALGHPLPMRICVPFCYQSRQSGIHDESIHEILWYKRKFQVPASFSLKRVLIKFGAVDYLCNLYINGKLAGNHEGGYTPFAIDITDLLHDGFNEICLRVEDRPDCTQPRGKQYWKKGWTRCWYVGCSGIWQSVYLEAVEKDYLTDIRVIPDIDCGIAEITLKMSRKPIRPLYADIEIRFQDELVRFMRVMLREQRTSLSVSMAEPSLIEDLHLWSPGSPNLYDVCICIISDEGEIDAVTTYFGMRKVAVHNGYVLLNNRALYQRLILYQGYWPDTLMTPPSTDAIRTDVEWAIRLGYNGVRMHQKIEDPRFYYWADVLGLLVWGEMPAAFEFDSKTVSNMCNTLIAFIERDFNHPSIIAWVPLNESWGVTRIYNNAEMQSTATMLYHLCKSLDSTRIVSTNDGWEQVQTDIFGLHDYSARGDILSARFESRRTLEKHANGSRMSCAKGFIPTGDEAFLVTEYGGISFSDGQNDTWGYRDKVRDEDAFFERFKDITDAIRAIPFCRGYCYTQLTDVRQETNGLLTADRKPKVDITQLCKLNCNPAQISMERRENSCQIL